MNKKITRRVVLGTAIAGLVAGPFVIRELRKKKVKDLEEIPYMTLDTLPPPPPPPSVRGQFFDEWKAYRQQFLSPIPIQNEQKTVTLIPNLSKERTWNFRNLETSVLGVFSHLDEFNFESSMPMYYTIVEGTIHTKDENFVVTVKKNELKQIGHRSNPKNSTQVKMVDDRVISVSHEREPHDKIEVIPRSTGNFNFVFRNDIYGMDGQIMLCSQPISEENEDMAMLHNSFLSLLKYICVGEYPIGTNIDLPAKRVLTVGWNDPDVLKINLAKLNDKLVAVVTGEQSLDSEQFRNYAQKLVQKFMQELEPKDWKLFNEPERSQIKAGYRQIEKDRQSAIVRFLESEKSRYQKVTWCIDVKTGLVIQHERLWQSRDNNGFTKFYQFQMLEV